MANYTAYYNLKKPLTTENYNIADQNGNMDLIDTALANKETPAGAQTKVDAHASNNVSHVPYGVATGSANTYAVTLSPAPTSYTDGMALCVKINVASTGASTINVNGLGAKSIKDSLGNVITAGGLKANTPYTMRYESTSGNFIVQGKGGGGNATAGDLLTGKTATVDSGQITGTLSLTGDSVASNVLNGKTFYNTDAKTKLTGTMTNRTGDNASIGSSISGTTLKLIAPGGFFDGVDDTVTITDPDFVASNIRKDVNLLGQIGTLVEGKRWATGSTGVIAAGSSYTVTGLTFKPNNIFMYEVYGSDTANVTRYATFWSTYTNSQQSFHTRTSGDTYAGIVTNIVQGGFTITAGANTVGGIIVREWLAFE